MTEQAGKRTKLATLLNGYQDEIANSWAEKIFGGSTSSEQKTSLAILTTATRQGVAYLVEYLNANSPESPEVLFDELTLLTLKPESDITEVIEYILLLKEAVLPFIGQSYAADPPMAFELIHELDMFVRSILKAVIGRQTQRDAPPLGVSFDQPILPPSTRESLQRVTTALLQKLTGLDETLEIVCFEARQLTGATGSAVLLWEDEGWLRVVNSSGTPTPALERLPASDSFAGRVINQGKPMLLNEPEGQVQVYYRNPDLKTLLAIPLRANNKIIGTLDVVNKEGGFIENDIQIMSLFADQAAIAIENARLHEQSEQLAVIEERQRLARELHDSVTQNLYSMKLYADATRMALAAEQTQVAAENLEELRNLAREAMLDMRMLIFELHPPKLEDEGLASALQARLETVEARSGIQIHFYVEGDRQLPLALEEELYRITQEALNNVVKHAKAQQVIVHLWYESEQFVLEIQDDGIGLEKTAAARHGGLGLRNIKDRVQSIGGKLTITSVPEKGTSLRVELPL